jgi:ribosomal protein L23
VTKLELREFFEKVYGVAVKQVHTNIVLGRLRTKRDKQGNLTRERVKGSDYKLAWVEFDEKIPLQKPSIKPLAHVRALAESL